MFLTLDVSFPYSATTHSDLVLRAVNAGIQYRVIHNASIMNAVGCCGLQVRPLEVLLETETHRLAETLSTLLYIYTKKRAYNIWSSMPHHLNHSVATSYEGNQRA